MAAVAKTCPNCGCMQMPRANIEAAAKTATSTTKQTSASINLVRRFSQANTKIRSKMLDKRCKNNTNSINAHQQHQANKSIRQKKQMLVGYSCLLFVSLVAAATTNIAQLASCDEQRAQTRITRTNQGTCQVFGGESVAIVEIAESRGTDFSQSTVPAELPIVGNAAEIELKIESETHKYFEFAAGSKRLRLIKPLDRDAVYNATHLIQQAISSIYLQVSCVDKRQQLAPNGAKSAPTKVIIPTLVKIVDLNDNAPRFAYAPQITVSINELTPIGSIIVNSSALLSIDADSGNNAQLDYSLEAVDFNGSNSREIMQDGFGASNLITNQPLSSTSSPSSLTLQYTTTTPPPPPFPPTTTLASTIRSTAAPSFNLNNEAIVNGRIDSDSLPSLIGGGVDDDDAYNNSEPSLSSSSSSDDDGDFLSALGSTPSSLLKTSSSGTNSGSKENIDDDDEEDDNDETSDNVSSSKSPQMSSLSPAVESRARRAATSATKPTSWTNVLRDGFAARTVHASAQNENTNTVTKNDDELSFFELDFSGGGSGGQSLGSTQRPAIKLKRALDFETRRVHSFLVRATDRATPPSDRKSTTTRIVVRVVDGNDQPPVFVLEQFGCATSVAPQMSPSSSSPSSSSTPRIATKTIADSLSALDSGTNKHGQPSPPRNFVASDANLDFGDDDSSALLDAYYNGHGHRAPTAGGCLTSATNGLVEYRTVASRSDRDIMLHIEPAAIKARDRDELNAPIRYSFVNGTPANYTQYFRINQIDGSVRQLSPIFDTTIERFELAVRAQEVSGARLSTMARLVIEVQADDEHRRLIPMLSSNSRNGFVAENAPVGSLVMTSSVDGAGKLPLRLSVSFADKSTSKSSLSNLQTSAQSQSQGKLFKQQKHFEIHTTSDVFKVDSAGFVFVNKSNLDADAPQPAVHVFQATLIASSSPETSSSSFPDSSSSLQQLEALVSPLTLNVTILDINDNAPQLVNTSLAPITMLATVGGSKSSNAQTNGGSHKLTTIRAFDLDSASSSSLSATAENSQATTTTKFSILHVSANASHRFRIDADGGELEAIGKFVAGEQFSVTVQVCDELRRCSQGIVEVIVAQAPSTQPPHFVYDRERHIGGYQAHASEDLAIGSPVLQVRAVGGDGNERAQIVYKLLDSSGGGGSGSSQSSSGDFAIDTTSGLITVAQRLDREEVAGYSLQVQARDLSGFSSTNTSTNNNLIATTSVAITIEDVNDENPVFSARSYTFELAEGTFDAHLDDNNKGKELETLVGVVHATDGDVGDNARLKYSLIVQQHEQHDLQQRQIDNLFRIDTHSGAIYALRSLLDYESARSHLLLVTATDCGEKPRSTTVSVLIKVLDVQDQAPFFDLSSALGSLATQSSDGLIIEASVVENLPLARVTQVRAFDLDSTPQITYTLIEGNASLFEVNSRTGLVQVSAKSGGLDFEVARQHFLTVGTLETKNNWNQQTIQNNTLNFKSPVVKIYVTVIDTNDNKPVLVDASVPLRVADTSLAGSFVANLLATDGDNSEPNNKVKFELLSDDDNCARNFVLDSISGALSIKTDLRFGQQDDALLAAECVLKVRLSDMGSPSLSSVGLVPIFIDHTAESLSSLSSSSSSQASFADSTFAVELDENVAADSLVKTLRIINKSPHAAAAAHQSRLRSSAGFYQMPVCEIIAGNELGKFYVIENQASHDCELRVAKDAQLDTDGRQQPTRFKLTVKLLKSTSVSTITIQLVDKNDNKPVFELPARYSHLTQNKLLAAIANDAPTDSQVLAIKATDADLPPNGLVSYELLADNQIETKFKIDAQNGILRTSKPLEDIPTSRMPIKLHVVARDNPQGVSSSSSSVIVDASLQQQHSSIVELLVNLIDDKHRIVLSLIDTPASQVLDVKEELLSILQERSGLIPGVERCESLKVLRNNSIEPDVSSTDFWFYLIEPGTFKIVSSDDSRVKATLFDSKAQKSLADIIGDTLGFNLARVRQSHPHAASFSSSFLLGGLSRRPSLARAHEIQASAVTSLILLAIVMGIFSVAGLMYQCAFAEPSSSSASASTTMTASSNARHDAKNRHSKPIKSKDSKHIQHHHYRQSTTQQQQEQQLQQPFFNQFLQFAGLNKLSHDDDYTLAPQVQPQSLSIQDTAVCFAKEYETQMLKMSVLFDDCTSVDEHQQQQQQHYKKIAMNPTNK